MEGKEAGARRRQVAGKYFEIEVSALVQGKDSREIFHFGLGFTTLPPAMVDHAHGSWYRRCSRQNEPYFREKTKPKLCVDPDYHILGGLNGALSMLP